jgi:heme-degrading monooxygenase HmoA
MLVILFRSTLTPEAGEDYGDMGDAMLEHARSQPGFVDYKQYHTDDRERLTVVWWKDEATLEQWRNDSRHVAAKKMGRDRWYQDYHIEIAKVVHEAHYVRES